MGKIYKIYNSTATSTAAPVKQPTGTAIRTMLQVRLGVGRVARVCEWGISFDGSAAALPGMVELFSCSGAATMSTATVNADVMPTNDQYAFVNASDNPFALSTTLTGFATAAVTEGTVANYRALDTQLIAPTSQYVKQWPLGREPEFNRFLVDGSTACFIRVRVTFAATVNAHIYIDFEV